jgi:hypothetical protein
MGLCRVRTGVGMPSASTRRRGLGVLNLAPAFRSDHDPTTARKPQMSTVGDVRCQIFRGTRSERVLGGCSCSWANRQERGVPISGANDHVKWGPTAGQAGARVLFHDDAASMWIGSEHPQLQRAFRERPLEPQPQLLTGPRQPQSFVHSQSAQPDFGCD